MKIHFAITLAAITATTAFTGCKQVNGKGPVVSKNYDLSGFDKVQLSNEGNVILVNDVNQFVEVRTHENLFDGLELKVNDSRLEIGNKKGYSIGKYDELAYYVHAPIISEVYLSGSGDITGGDGVAAAELLAKISGSGKITLNDLSGQHIEGNISGSGDIVLNGQTSFCKLTISGSGEISAFGLMSEDTDAHLSGSGDIETTSTGTLNIQISGSGDVKYKGTPIISQNISGSGSVINAN